MALFVCKPTDLTTHGPVIEVKLWVPQQVQLGPPPVNALAEINTAFARTYIQEGVATGLGLEPAGKATIDTAVKPKFEAYVFRIRIAFPENKMVFEVMAVEIPYMLRPYARIKCLIGRDILQYGTLHYDGPTNTFSLKF